MTTSHLQTCEGAIRCVGCGHMFEVPGFILTDPMQLVEMKEEIAAKHVCCGPRQVKTPVRVMRNPNPVQSNGEFVSAMQRLMASNA